MNATGSINDKFHQDFKIYEDSDGEHHFPLYSEYGSYPLIYLCDKQVGHCPYCALEDAMEEGTSYKAYPVFEGMVFCDQCGCEIGEYGSDED